ncbi:MAG TPA: hypothetical protein VLA64_11690, partial [Azonexus sp.]|nr:hypothetical protein [Azonexus sp.]
GTIEANFGEKSILDEKNEIDPIAAPPMTLGSSREKVRRRVAGCPIRGANDEPVGSAHCATPRENYSRYRASR